jgi:flagellar biosynthesis GTPase FlhF
MRQISSDGWKKSKLAGVWLEVCRSISEGKEWVRGVVVDAPFEPEFKVPALIDSGALRHVVEAEPEFVVPPLLPRERWNAFTRGTWGDEASWSPRQIAIDAQEKQEMKQHAKERRRRQQRERKSNNQARQPRQNPQREERKRGPEQKTPADALGVAQLAELRKIVWMMKKEVEDERRSAERRRRTLMANHNDVVALQERRHRQILAESWHRQVMNWVVAVVLLSLVYLVLIK